MYTPLILLHSVQTSTYTSPRMHLIIFLSLQEKGKHSMEKDNEQQTLGLEIYGLFLDDCDLLISRKVSCLLVIQSTCTYKQQFL